MESINSAEKEIASVRELFVAKKDSCDGISKDLQEALEGNLGIEGIKGVKIYNNYIVDDLTDGEFETSKRTVFSEAPVDDIFSSEEFYQNMEGKTVIPIESNAGQYDNRVDAVQQNLMLQTGRSHNTRFKSIIVIDGNISQSVKGKIKKWIINPVEKHESHLDDRSFDRKIGIPENHVLMNGFMNFLGDGSDDKRMQNFLKTNSLSISLEDLKIVLEYFKNEEKRDPTRVELMLIDTYWSDHCRHTTFNAKIHNIEVTGEEGLVKNFKDFNKKFQEKSKEKGKEGNTFMELATASFRFLKDDPDFKGSDFIDVSIEDNAASYKTIVEMEDGTKEEWIIMFKNETHNSPTEVEPFGGAATCLGGAIRDTLSGRAFTFAAMRVSGSRNPTEPVSETDINKLSQRAISIGAALGYASYGNQIGLATGRVQEYFHPGYAAKRFECGYVLAAVKEENIKREVPELGDLVIMCGGKTGRDGVGGANVSSHESGGVSLKKAGAHVQKGNPINERVFQRILLQPKFTRMIKRSNDFGAGGVSVAIGELSRGIDIDLDAVAQHTKYAGLSDEELAISESQERMSFVIDPKDQEEFMRWLNFENIEGFIVGTITNQEDENQDRLVMNYEGQKVANLSRSFLDKNGAERTANASVNLKKPDFFDTLDPQVQKFIDAGDYTKALLAQLSLLENASQRGLQSGFDASVGASTILAPFGGKYQTSPQVGMVNKIPTFHGVDAKTGIISVNGFHPYLMEQNEYIGGMYTIIEAISKITALGGEYEKSWLSLQEYFGKLTSDEKYGKVYAGLLGTLQVLLELKVAAIGGKDSMSGTAKMEDGERLDVPSTIVSFANVPVDTSVVISSEFKEVGNKIVCLKVPRDSNGLPNIQKYQTLLKELQLLIKGGHIKASSVVGNGGVITALCNMSLGNKIGFKLHEIGAYMFQPNIGDIILEVSSENIDSFADLKIIGETIAGEQIQLRDFGNDDISIEQAQAIMEGTLEGVWPTKRKKTHIPSINEFAYRISLDVKEVLTKQPIALLPVFPGTNSELDTKHALLKEGFKVEEFVFNTQSPESFEASRKEFATLLGVSDLLVFSGGFSAGDEPDGSAKFIVNMMKSPEIREAFQRHLDNRSKLTLGICNGFQALIKMGVFESSQLKDELQEYDETLTYNDSLRHETGLVRLRVASILSPFMSAVNLGNESILPISHGEGKILISPEKFEEYQKKGQIPLQYLDVNGDPTNEYNGSYAGIAALTDSTGRILGMMPHPERTGLNVFKNVPGKKLLPILRGAYQSLRGNK